MKMLTKVNNSGPAVLQEETGARIATIRRQLGMSQDGLAREIEAKRAALSMWERGKRAPDIDAMIRLADRAGTSLDWIFGRDGREDS